MCYLTLNIAFRCDLDILDTLKNTLVAHQIGQHLLISSLETTIHIFKVQQYLKKAKVYRCTLFFEFLQIGLDLSAFLLQIGDQSVHEASCKYLIVLLSYRLKKLVDVLR